MGKQKKKVWIMIMVMLIMIGYIKFGMDKYVSAKQVEESKKITVLVDLNGGNINGNTEYAIVGKTGETTRLEKPVHEGYDFGGYDCTNGKLKRDGNQSYTYTFGNTSATIKAIWHKKEYIILSSITPETVKHTQTTAMPKVTEHTAMTITPVTTSIPVIPTIPAATIIPDTVISPLTVTTIKPTIIPALKHIKKGKIKISKKLYYTKYGKKVIPNIKITYQNKKLLQNKNYKVKYKNNTKYGKGKIIIKGIGSYKGTVEKDFYILPDKTKIIKNKTLIKSKNEIEIVWKKLMGVDGYQILYSKTKKGKFKEISRKSNKQTIAAFWTFQKQFYMKIRPYIVIDGKCWYGKCSDILKIKIKS